MSDAVRNRAVFGLVAAQVARTTAAVDEAAAAYVAARERLEEAYADHVRWCALGDEAARLPMADEVTNMLGAVARCRARIEAARAGDEGGAA